MLKYFIIIFFFCFSIVSCKKEKDIEPEDNDIEIKAMSYNIRIFSLDDIANGDGWDDRKAELSTLILNQNADFIGIQEDIINQQAFIREKLKPDYDFIDGLTNGDITQLLNTLYYKKHKYRLLQKGKFWLSETPDKISIGWDANEKRCCIYGQFENLNTSQKIWVFNTHFDNSGAIARQNSAILVRNKIQDLTAKDSLAKIIFLGDINVDVNTEEGQSVHDTIKTYLNDAQYFANVFVGPIGTYSGFKGSVSASIRLDYIYMRNFTCTHYYHLPNLRKNGHYPSDHLPVVAIFQD